MNALVAPPILQQLYTLGSLRNTPEGAAFSLKNRLVNATLTQVVRVDIDGVATDPADLRLELPGGRRLPLDELSSTRPLPFPLRAEVHVHARRQVQLVEGPHAVRLCFEAGDLGRLDFEVHDTLQPPAAPAPGIPCNKEDNHGPGVVRARQDFVARFTGVRLQHLDKYSFDPAVARNNIENFTGVAQVPIGLAGPLRVNGEHAQGEFLIPLATTEGTLVASYNRGMKVLNLSGGVACTISADCMQRAPVFGFDSAREARQFKVWVDQHLDEIRTAAHATSHVARLVDIDTYLASKFAYVRFNFTTGDAAGQNMVGRATLAACSWITGQVTTVRQFYLESNLATDKKSSHVNVLRTRGKRVTAEAVIPRALLRQHLRVEPESLCDHSRLGTIGAFLSGANNNGAHSPNGITAMFIATGQDVANVAESCAGILYADLTRAGDLYLSITIPSLIVATHGGGTALPTQRECLEILGCTGPGTVHKLAEIVAGVVLAGELSLGAAISSMDWVSSHEKYGRNR